MANETINVMRRLAKRILTGLKNSPYQTNPVQIVRERAAQDSADYIEANLAGAMLFPEKEGLWDHVSAREFITGGLHLEFGVFKGTSINHFSRNLPNLQFFGFDSFRGLQEDWEGYHMSKGHFDLDGKLPKVNTNVTLIPGWFDDTLPNFLEENSGPLAFMHVDCDTYESSNYVIQTVGGRIVEGTVIVFDEYHGYANWRNGEFRAWQEWVEAHGVTYRYLAFSDMQSAIVVTGVSEPN